MNLQSYDVTDLVCNESFQQYCLGASAEVMAYWEDLARHNPTLQTNMVEAKALVLILSARQGNGYEQLQQLRDGIIEHEQLQSRLFATGETGMPVPSKPSTKKLLLYTTSIAASICLLIAAWQYFRHTPLQQNITPAIASQVYASGITPRKTVILPDGSVIILRDHSTLTLHEGFNAQHREVSLAGEAFFDVQHDAGKPFVVQTAATRVTVLGTTFNIRAYPKELSTETMLLKGKVSVTLNGGEGKHEILDQPYQSMIVGNSTSTKPLEETVKRSNSDTKKQELTWLRSRLEIENEPLEKIALKLEKWYGIPVKFEDESVKSYRYSGTFESETVVKALQALQLSYPFTFNIKNNEIVISK
ncbi:FecR family protein [Chitinophaga skermanii]|uniref:FecR family protein n=1 Tax=Chitinophaga skermanii TaxID=331697 RepID=A0A327QRV7_9BACT|nr:FecR domain-containing protein [Chitinophaga skermanii]RAJ06635.1 FecR family protein [Chitinophaga skermanii]